MAQISRRRATRDARVTFRLPQWLRDQLRELATHEHRTLSNYIETKLLDAEPSAQR